jgi:hypothetical protein
MKAVRPDPLRNRSIDCSTGFVEEQPHVRGYSSLDKRSEREEILPQYLLHFSSRPQLLCLSADISCLIKPLLN